MTFKEKYAYSEKGREEEKEKKEKIDVKFPL